MGTNDAWTALLETPFAVLMRSSSKFAKSIIIVSKQTYGKMTSFNTITNKSFGGAWWDRSGWKNFVKWNGYKLQKQFLGEVVKSVVCETRLRLLFFYLCISFEIMRWFPFSKLKCINIYNIFMKPRRRILISFLVRHWIEAVMRNWKNSNTYLIPFRGIKMYNMINKANSEFIVQYRNQRNI